jgi:glycosyltransferase involved in cell wall biosynthesis
MKIACIATSRVPSSTANSIQVMKACHALAELGHTVCLLIPGEKAVEWQSLENFYGLKTPFEVRWLPSQAMWRRYDFSLEAVREAKHWGAQMVYTWLLPAAVMSLWYQFPTLLELHDVVKGRLGPQSYRLFCLHRKTQKRLLVITQALKNKLEDQSRLSLPANEVLIAPNGTDLERYASQPPAAEARAALNFPETFSAVYTGHFYAGRGMDLLLGLAQRLPQVHFLWVGGSEGSVKEWEKRLSELCISNVTLTGFVPNSELPLYQAAGEVLLMPYEKSIAGSSGGNSADICSPMKMFDYLATGRVIISSDLPVIHEVLNTENAIFCPPDDLNAWVEAMEGLINDPQRRSCLAEQARRDAARYTWVERARRALEGF